MARPEPRIAEVISVTQISKHMRRVTLGGTGLREFPAQQSGAYIKLFFDGLSPDQVAVRTYTVRAQREDCCEIDVDFVLHGEHGIAGQWAARVEPGEHIKIGGPGAKKPVAADADWVFLVGDMTALPALGVNLESLPDSVCGYAVIEILDEADRQVLSAPEGVAVDWVVAANNDVGREQVLSVVRSKAWLPGRPAIWAASELDTMKALRAYFKKERKVPTSDAYISSYWKQGVAEDEHKVLKRRDAEEESS